MAIQPSDKTTHLLGRARVLTLTLLVVCMVTRPSFSQIEGVACKTSRKSGVFAKLIKCFENEDIVEQHARKWSRYVGK